MIEAQPSVSCYSFECGNFPASVSISRFQGAGGVEEHHFIVRPRDYADTETQLGWVEDGYRFALQYAGVDPETSVFRRFFCSDVTNQASVIESHSFARQDDVDRCAVSWVGQPPALPAKVALWAYHICDPNGELRKSKIGGSLSVSRGDLSHVWTTGVTCTDANGSYDQTNGIFRRYEDLLRSNDCTLADNVVRTWFFVRDVDANYKGLVDARRQVFSERGLTSDTHYIASTGIEGSSANIAAEVTMDAYAVSGLRADQVEFLSAPDYLSPTSIYGVTFERGTSVAYQDRKQVLISGTASIDSAGQVVHPGDVARQLDRTLENIEALLREAGATLQNVCVLLVYVRDASDIGLIEQSISERFGEAPFQVVVAPVCRPGWLVEIECQAIVPHSCPTLPAF